MAKTLVPTKKAVPAKKAAVPKTPTPQGPVRPTLLSNNPYGQTVYGPSVIAQKAAAPVASAVAPDASGGYSGGGGGGGGGLGGGGGVGASDVGISTPLTFDDFISKNFGYNQLRTEQGRQLSEFDNDTLRQRQLTEADQGLKRAALGKALSQMGSDWANDSASRGLLRSGLYLQGQDKVDQAGVTGNQDIDQMLTDLLGERGQGRVSLEQQQRAALNDVLSQLSQQFNKQLGIAA